METTLAALNFAIHFVGLANLVLEISALQIFVKAFVGNNLVFFFHVVFVLVLVMKASYTAVAPIGGRSLS